MHFLRTFKAPDHLKPGIDTPKSFPVVVGPTTGDGLVKRVFSNASCYFHVKTTLDRY